MGSQTDNTPPLPDTSTWQPRSNKTETLAEAFFRRCEGVEQDIIDRAMRERRMNIDNFDSGPGVEDIVREALVNLLPRRYSVRDGVINDRLGRTAGDFDVILFNDLWFPALKAGATLASRRFHLPIEGVYAVLEVKQSLDYSVMDQAMEKLVTCHRLLRPPTSRGRIVENTKLDDCPHATKNPLFSCILATDLRPNITMEQLVNRFYDINRTLRRREVVRALCVLGHGCVTWAAVTSKKELKPALFQADDLYWPIIPVFYRVGDIHTCALYPLMMHLMTHLYTSILAAEDIAIHYGGSMAQRALFPDSSEINLPPDDEDRKEQEFVENFFAHLARSSEPEPDHNWPPNSGSRPPRQKRGVRRRQANPRKVR